MKHLIFLVLLALIGCSSKPPKDNEVIEKNVKAFAMWYSNNWDSLAVKLIEPMIENSMVIPGDTNMGYSINFEKAEVYLSVFKKSGFVSDKYIKDYREYFKKCQKNFELEPQPWGPAAGFEYDFIYKTQDYSYQVENADKALVKEIKISGNTATAVLFFTERTYYAYKLSKVDGKWLIDVVGTEWMPSGFSN